MQTFIATTCVRLIPGRDEVYLIQLSVMNCGIDILLWVLQFFKTYRHDSAEMLLKVSVTCYIPRESMAL
jgi:hypothetical protein